MTDPRPLEGDDIKRLMAEVAERLEASGTQHVVVIVGGSLLAWHGLRDSTVDVDNVQRLDEETRDAVREVARAHGLDPDWLNAGAARFAPATLSLAECERLLETPGLLVLGPPLRLVFVMKLLRSQPNDLADMVRMFPATGFATANEVVDAYSAAYPNEEPDPWLSDLVVDIARRAGHRIS